MNKWRGNRSLSLSAVCAMTPKQRVSNASSSTTPQVLTLVHTRGTGSAAGYISWFRVFLYSCYFPVSLCSVHYPSFYVRYFSFSSIFVVCYFPFTFIFCTPLSFYWGGEPWDHASKIFFESVYAIWTCWRVRAEGESLILFFNCPRYLLTHNSTRYNPTIIRGPCMPCIPLCTEIQSPFLLNPIEGSEFWLFYAASFSALYGFGLNETAVRQLTKPLCPEIESPFLLNINEKKGVHIFRDRVGMPLLLL